MDSARPALCPRELHASRGLQLGPAEAGLWPTPTQRTPLSTLTQEHTLCPEGHGGHLSCLPTQQPRPQPPSLRTQDQHCHDTLSGTFQHVGEQGAVRVSSPTRLGARGGWGPATPSTRSSPGRGWADSRAVPPPAQPLRTGGTGQVQAGSPGLPGSKQPCSYVSCFAPEQAQQLDGPCSPASSSQGGEQWVALLRPSRTGYPPSLQV